MIYPNTDDLQGKSDSDLLVTPTRKSKSRNILAEDTWTCSLSTAGSPMLTLTHGTNFVYFENFMSKVSNFYSGFMKPKVNSVQVHISPGLPILKSHHFLCRLRLANKIDSSP